MGDWGREGVPPCATNMGDLRRGMLNLSLFRIAQAPRSCVSGKAWIGREAMVVAPEAASRAGGPWGVEQDSEHDTCTGVRKKAVITALGHGRPGSGG